MSFTSAEFIGFLLLTLAAYYLLPRRFQWIVLLVASYGFYLCGGVGALGYLLFTTLTTYGPVSGWGSSTSGGRPCRRRRVLLPTP